MAKVTVTIELDQAAYDAKYGPGSEHWAKYHGQSFSDGEYKSLEGQVLEDAIVDTLHEGFYDWQSQGWLKLKVDGKAVCKGCGRVEGRPHKGYCKTVVGAEASEV